MTSYHEIRKYVQEKYGFYAKNTYIAHAKEVYGLPIKKSANRKGKERRWPCPEKRLVELKDAFVHFGILKE